MSKKEEKKVKVEKVKKEPRKKVKFFRRLLRTFTSRYFISSILIILEVVLIFLIQKHLNDMLIIFYILSYIVSAVSLLYLINCKAIPETKLPWMLIILLFQPFGVLLFIMFGNRLITRNEKNFFKHLLNDNGNALIMDDESLEELHKEDKAAYQNAYALSKESGSPIYKNTYSKYYPSGEDFYPELLKQLEGAKKYIFMEYFIVNDGVMWDSILEILKRKVKEGVEVRFIYDDIGCLFYLPSNYYKKLNDYGIKALCFAKYTGKANSSHNNRSHRKITVIDGKIGYTGGINLSDEYINVASRFGYWKDSVIEIRGKAVKELVKIYLYDWDLNSNNVSKWSDYITDDEVTSDGYVLPFGAGPRPLYRPNIAKNMYLNLINQAVDYIYITTPYLIIDTELTNALMNAAKRGVDVTLITPHIPDKKYVYALTKNSYIPLLDEGVKIYEFEPGFIHAKNFISDDKYAICGTINFDYRSLIHHYENAIWMYKTEALKSMKKDFLDTLDKSIPQTRETAKQNFFTNLFVGLIKIFAPFF